MGERRSWSVGCGRAETSLLLMRVLSRPSTRHQLAPTTLRNHRSRGKEALRWISSLRSALVYKKAAWLRRAELQDNQ